MFGLGSIQIAVIAIIGTIILGLGGTVAYLHHANGALHAENATLTDQRDQAVKTAADNAAVAEKIAADAKLALEVQARDHAAALVRAQRSQTLKTEIARATPAEDAPAAVVLIRTRDRMRGAGNADQAGAGASQPAGGPPVVRPGTPAPR